MAGATEQSDVDIKLSEMFDKMLSNFEFIENSTGSTSSDIIQTKIEESIALGETAVYRVNELGLFTTNENIEEVATGEIKYLILPALLGQFLMRGVRASDSFESLKKAQVYLIDFIRLLHLYGVTTIEPPKPFSSTTDVALSNAASSFKSNIADDLASQQRKRQTKIDRYRQQKLLTEELKSLFAAVQLSHVEEEVKRNYYMKLLDKWLSETLNSLDQLETELELVYHMSKMGGAKVEGGAAMDSAKTSKCVHNTASHKPTGLLRPFIITKDSIQSKVFGIGYPGIPTYSVDEFYQQRVEQGIFPDSTHGKGPVAITNPESEAAVEREKSVLKKEKQEEDDDEETLRNARQWDDWKDEHRRGWGNTYNKS